MAFEVNNSDQYVESISTPLYPMQSYSWTLEDAVSGKKTADKTLVTNYETGVPQEIAHFFVPKNQKITYPLLITFLVNDRSFTGKLTTKPGNRLVLNIKNGKQLLSLEKMESGVDEIWFEAKDSNLPTFRIYTKTSDEKIDIKPRIKDLKEPSKLTRMVNYEVRDSAAQRYFKSLVTKVCGNCCIVTGVEDREPSILIASHIVPWAGSDDDHKIDGYNGLMLAPHVDRLFDTHLITFTKDGYIEVADEQTKKALQIWGIDINKKYSLHEKHLIFLEKHRRTFDDKKNPSKKFPRLLPTLRKQSNSQKD